HADGGDVARLHASRHHCLADGVAHALEPDFLAEMGFGGQAHVGQRLAGVVHHARFHVRAADIQADGKVFGHVPARSATWPRRDFALFYNVPSCLYNLRGAISKRKDQGMIDRLHHRGWHYVLLIGISGLMFFVNLGGATLWDIDEGRNMECAYEMMEANNWIVPTFNSALRVDKPALLYWLQILSYRCFGVNEFAGRLPSALAALATVLLAYELARSMFTRTTGLIAGVVVATTPMLCGAARFANPDALLNFATVLTLTIFWLGLSARRWWWF